MEEWMKISLLLCVFGFVKEFRPLEPFTFDFLTGPSKNFTEDEVIKQAYPAATYSNLICLVLVFLITDICRYKPLIILLGLAGVAVYTIILWTYSVFQLIIAEVLYGLFRAAEVAYFSYIYSKVDKEHFQKVTSHTRGAILAGRSISGVASQVFVSTKLLGYLELNYVTLTSVGIATVWAFFLPPVKKSLYFHSEGSKDLSFSQKAGLAFNLMKSHFISAYTNLYVFKWSVWWALSTCGYVQVEMYLQPLYSAIEEDNNNLYNGAVEAIITLLGFFSALMAGYIKFNWEIKGEITLGVFSLLQGTLIVIVSQTEYLLLCYAFYVTFGVLYHFMITIASAEIAKKIDEDSYGLIFGINTFVSLVFNAILTAIVATEGSEFALNPREQYIVYGGYHLVISLLFIGIGLRTCMKKKPRQLDEEVEKKTCSDNN